MLTRTKGRKFEYKFLVKIRSKGTSLILVHESWIFELGLRYLVLLSFTPLAFFQNACSMNAWLTRSVFEQSKLRNRLVPRASLRPQFQSVSYW